MAATKRKLSMRRSIIAVVVLALGLVTVSGCAVSGSSDAEKPQKTQSAQHPAGIGQTAGEFNATKGLPESVSKVDAKSGDISTDGTPTYVTAIELVLVPGTGVTDADAMLDWIMRAGWSINDNQPEHVIARLTYLGHDNVDWDYVSAIRERGLDPKTTIEIYGDSLTFSFTAEELQASLGEWPAAAPRFPAAALGTRNGVDLMTQAFEDIKPAGVASVNIGTSHHVQGLRFSYTTTVRVILEAGYVPANDTHALVWLISTAWSINDHKPESVILELTYADGSAVPWDPDVVLHGWGLGRPTTEAVLNFYGPDLEKIVGAWPGDAPTVNVDGIFVPHK